MAAQAANSSFQEASPYTRGQPHKLRKGTFSCWECKRRKARCEAGKTSTESCLWCERHGLLCVSQAHDDPIDKEHVAVEDRLDRLEDTVRIAVLGQPRSRSSIQSGSSDRTGVRKKRKTKASVAKTSRICDIAKYNDSQSPLSLLQVSESVLTKRRSLSGHLNALLPTASVTAKILADDHSPLGRLLQPLRIIQSSVPGATRLSWSIQTPSPNAHPVAFARKLLQLAIGMLQLTISSSECPELKLGGSLKDNIRRYVEGAQHVTSQDVLVNSIDGLETLMLEGFLQIITGSYDDARPTLKRALGLAQVVGLPCTKPGEEYYRKDTIWFRLNNMDRAVALRLGLPHATFDNAFASDAALAADIPHGKLSRIHAMVSGRLITRNLHILRQRSCTDEEADMYDDRGETEELNEHLKRGAGFLPSEWWLQPTAIKGKTDLETRDNVTRMSAQLEHYYILLLLYQPYIFLDHYRTASAGGTNDIYSRITALSAGRQIITSFQLLSGAEHLPTIYKNLEHKGLLAVLAILVVHIESHQSRHANILEHQRMQDLQVVGRAIDYLENLARLTEDPTDLERIQNLRHLVTIEEGAKSGGSYFIKCAGNDRTVPVPGESVLKFEVPFFGHISIEKRNPPELNTISHPQPTSGSYIEFDEGLELDNGGLDPNLVLNYDLDDGYEPYLGMALQPSPNSLLCYAGTSTSTIAREQALSSYQAVD